MLWQILDSQDITIISTLWPFFLLFTAEYNPNTGRWLNRDPIQEQGGLNLYDYGSDSPINEDEMRSRLK